MKLYYAPQSRAVRVAWLLEELGLDYELEKFTVGDPALRSPEYRATHPVGRVPAIQDGDVTLFESGAIVDYIIARYGNGRMIPAVESPEFPIYLQWFHYCEGMIMPPMNAIVVETILLPPERASEVHEKRARKLLGQMLMAFGQFMDGREFVTSELSGADIMIGHATVMSRRFGIDMPQSLMDYADRLEARPAFQRAEAH